ncbi:MAG: hypothetical protein HY690_20925 [Chloroflexi bacterium]|nr:hypothetical protein [Chloroflexota bacterium]
MWTRQPRARWIVTAFPVLRAVAFALVLGVLSAGLAASEPLPPVIEFIEHDDAAQVDRYRVNIVPGSSLWEVATERLPLKALDEGHQLTFALLEQNFHKTFPGRPITQVFPGESFGLEVPAGTFVAKETEYTPTEDRYTSFNGDRLIHYSRDLYIVYRLMRKEKPNEAEVLLAGAQDLIFVPDPDPAELAKQVYQVDQPDFLQVRLLRDLLASGTPTPRVTVDLEHRYLDDFRNYRARALRVEEGENGVKAYVFSEAQADVPFLRVEDGVGDELDPAAFPRLIRVEYYKDGTIRKMLMTQPGDILAVLRQPENAKWARLYDKWDRWVEADAGALEPFASAVTSVGSLLPGRILMLTYHPKLGGRTSGSGAQCLGLPLVLLAGGLVLRRWRREKGEG